MEEEEGIGGERRGGRRKKKNKKKRITREIIRIFHELSFMNRVRKCSTSESGTIEV